MIVDVYYKDNKGFKHFWNSLEGTLAEIQKKIAIIQTGTTYEIYYKVVKED